jgi:hypothetical protein
MAKKIEITKSDGTKDEYRSTIMTGYHLHQGSNGVCVTKKPLFRQEEVVKCYPSTSVKRTDEQRCLPCEAINPTQRKTNFWNNT